MQSHFLIPGIKFAEADKNPSEKEEMRCGIIYRPIG
jgi:hypothetical protein